MIPAANQGDKMKHCFCHLLLAAALLQSGVSCRNVNVRQWPHRSIRMGRINYAEMNTMMTGLFCDRNGAAKYELAAW